MSQSITEFENVTVTDFGYAFQDQDSIYGFLISVKDEFFLDEKIVLELSGAKYLIPFGFDDQINILYNIFHYNCGSSDPKHKQDLSFKNKFVGQTISVKTKESKDFKGYFEFIEFIEIA